MMLICLGKLLLRCIILNIDELHAVLQPVTLSSKNRVPWDDRAWGYVTLVAQARAALTCRFSEACSLCAEGL